MATVRVIISGRVQGVGYRAWAVRTARHMGIKGWVRNTHHHTVEALFHGTEEQVKAILIACEKGPMLARVEGIDTFPSDEEPEGHFTQKPTA